MSHLGGIYRAEVASIDDGEQRLQVSVRVHGVHSPEVLDSSLPVADVCIPAGRGMRGLFCPYQKGDSVFVQFEGGDIRFPVIIGGALSNKAGVNDTPFEMQGDTSGGGRIMLIDASGNALEMSSNPADLWVRLKSGGASITVSKSTDGVIVDAVGPILVKGGIVTVQAAILNAQAPVVNIEGRSGASAKGVATIDSDNRTDLMSDGSINIGGRVENILGLPSTPTRAPVTNVRSAVVNLGVGGASAVAVDGGTLETDSMPSIIGTDTRVPLLASTLVNIRSGVNVAIVAGDQVSVKAPVVAVTAIMRATVNAPIVSVTASASVNVSAPSINLGP